MSRNSRRIGVRPGDGDTYEFVGDSDWLGLRLEGPVWNGTVRLPILPNRELVAATKQDSSDVCWLKYQYR